MNVLNSFRSRIVILLFLVSALVVLALAVYTSIILNGVTAILNQETQARLVAESSSAMEVVSSDELFSLRAGHTTDNMGFQTVQNRLDAFIALHDIQSVYYAYLTEDGQLQYIIGAGEALNNNLTHAPVPINEMAQMAFNGAVATTQLYEYQSDSPTTGMLAGYAPIYGAGNEIVAIASVELTDSQILGIGRQINNLSIMLVASIIIVILVGCANVILQMRKENVLQRQLEQQDLMAHISQSFIAQRDIHELIREALLQIGDFLGVDHIFMMIMEEDFDRSRIGYHWLADPSSTSPSMMLPKTHEGAHDSVDTEESEDQTTSRHRKKNKAKAPATETVGQQTYKPHKTFYDAVIETFPSVLDENQQMKAVFCSNATSDFSKKFSELAQRGIASFVWTPIYIEGVLWGILSFEELGHRRIWREHDKQLIVSVCGALSGAIARNQIELERAAALDRAIQAGRAKSEFLSNMSHEMRTPMNAIIGMTTIALGSDDPARKDYCLSRINEASSHLLGIINDVLDMSKIEANKLELSIEEFRIEDTIRKVVNIISSAIKDRKQTLRVAIDRQLPPIISGDSQRFAQVLTNLLSNATKFTPEGGSIVLQARLLQKDSEKCVIGISITDSGIGISEDQLSRLFNSFEQAESSTSRRFGGTGLGLAISKRIVELMDGEITVVSNPGEGSTFSFTATMRYRSEDTTSGADGLLSAGAEPAAAGTAAAAAGTATAAAGTATATAAAATAATAAADPPQTRTHTDQVVNTDTLPGKPDQGSALATNAQGTTDDPAARPGLLVFPDLSAYRILLAEDIEINREIVFALLEPTGIQIEIASNGLQALRKIMDDIEQYDLIFMDMQMPEMDGLEATRRIRTLQHEKARRIPIVAMTANVFKEDVDKSLAAGMNDHIGKPLDQTEVIRILEQYLPAKPIRTTSN